MAVATGEIAGVESLSFRSTLSNGAAVEFRLAHQNDTVLFAAVDDLKDMPNRPVFTIFRDTFNLGKRQFDIELTPAGGGRAAARRCCSAATQQLFWPRGTADSARAQRTQGHGSISRKPAAEYPRPGAYPHSLTGRHANTAVYGGKTQRIPKLF